LRPPVGKRYKEMPGIDVLVEHPAGRRASSRRRVLANRAALIELLYAEPAPRFPGSPEFRAGVVVAERMA